MALVRPNQGAKGGPEADEHAPMSDQLEELRKKESKLVKGVFQDNEIRGGNVRFFFKKFKGDPIAEYTMLDGETYEIPIAVAKHLNSGCYYLKDSYSNHLITTDGKPMKNPTPKKVHRFSFKALELC